ncbi:hypothetical protein JCM16303_003581 [Sporobolomyces ruberrimus]
MPRGTAAEPPRRRSRSPATQGGEQNGDASTQQDLANLDLVDPLKTCRHLFLQSLISRRVVPKDLALQIYKDCVKLCKVDSPPELDDFLATIEMGLNLIGFELKPTRDQETGKILYILANAVQDTAAKLATEYKAEEIAFFKAIVAKIMLAREMSYCVSQTEAVKLAKPPVTRMLAIQLIKSFLAKGWLTLHPSSGRLLLSSRTLFELAPYIRETFAEDDEEDVEPRERAVVYCNYCTKIVTSGYACPNRHCGVRLHTYCANATMGGTGQCPDRLTNNANPCNQTWKKDAQTGKFVGHPVGVAALGLNDDDEAGPVSQMSDEEGDATPAPKKKKPAKKSNGRATKGKGKKKTAASDDDEDEEMDDDDGESDDEEGAGPATQTSVRRSSRRASTTKGQRRTIRPDSDEDEDEE